MTADPGFPGRLKSGTTPTQYGYCYGTKHPGARVPVPGTIPC